LTVDMSRLTNAGNGRGFHGALPFSLAVP